MSEQLAAKAVELDRLALDYRVKMTPAEATHFCTRKDPHLGDLLAEINKVIPVSQYEGDNPNNGKTHHHHYIGREGSRVVYVEVIRAYLDGDDTVKQVAADIQRLAKRYNADEINDEGQHGSIFYRIWWD